ncbi:hypothetical protein K8R33_03755 [archaeon]|nr:hypothetical protein [archaeon]
MDKKGMTMWTIVGLLIVLISGVVLLWVTGAFANLGSDSLDREACRNSVLLRAQTKILGNSPFGMDFDCETNLVEIDSKDEDEIYETIAGEMYDCWYQFAEGEKDFMPDWDLWKGDNWCFVCSRIDFSEDIKKEINNIPLSDFNDFLATERIPLGSKRTFYEYFYKVDSSGYMGYSTDSSVDLNDSLYVVFFADKRADLWKNFWETPDTTEIVLGVGSCVGGAYIGGAIGSVVLPVAGTAVGGVIGCAGGLIIDVFAETLARKTDYVSYLYVGSAEEVAGACHQ